MPVKNAFYAQSGGVTAVINASAAGVIETARKQKKRIGKVYAGRNGIIGALTEDLIDTSKETAKTIIAMCEATGTKVPEQVTKIYDSLSEKTLNDLPDLGLKMSGD